MTLKDDMANDRAVFLDSDEFADAATYTPNGGISTTVNVLVDKEPQVAEGQIWAVQAGTVQLTADSADVPNLGPGDTFEIGSTTYLVNGEPPKADEGGLVRFLVQEQ
jgi:hypothetical protein